MREISIAGRVCWNRRESRESRESRKVVGKPAEFVLVARNVSVEARAVEIPDVSLVETVLDRLVIDDCMACKSR